MFQRLLASAALISVIALPTVVRADSHTPHSPASDGIWEGYYIGTRTQEHPIYHFHNMYAYAKPSLAQVTCPHDAVVWINVDTHRFYERSKRLYGRTKRGGYACRGAAINVGERRGR